MIGRTSRRTLAVRLGCLVLLFAGGSSNAMAGGLAVQLSHGPRDVKQIALTFDDGSSPANCRRILAELVTAGVPATFFPIARAMQLDPALWRLIAQAGDPVGDHTLTHPEMPTLTYAQQVHQLRASRAIVESIIGRPMLDVFRPPYGAWDAATLGAAKASGFPTVLTWDTSDRDTSPKGTLDEMLAAADSGTSGSVILLHCGPNATPYLVPSVIDHYRSLGYRFVTVPQLLGLSWTPGAVAAVTPAMFLGSLTPLPAVSKGGPIVGANGWTAPIASPGASAPAAPSGPPRSSRAPSTPAPSPTAALPTASPHLPTSAGPSAGPSSGAIAVVAASPAATPSGERTTQAGGSTGVAAAGLALGLASIAAACVIVLTGVLRARRRRRRA